MRRILIIFAVVVLAYATVQIARRRSSHRMILTAVTVCYTAGFIYFTFFSRAPGDSRINLVPFFAFSASLRYPVHLENFRTALMSGNWELVFTTFMPIRNAILNIFLFIPFGFLLPEWKKRMTPVQVLLAGFLTSLAVEIIQVTTDCGWFDVDDLICNFIGNVLGILLYKAGTGAGRGNLI